MRFAQKNRFGDKRQNARKKTEKPGEEADRNNEKDNFDGTAGTLSTGLVDVPDFIPSSAPEKKKRDTSNRSDNYNTMAVNGTPVVHPSDESKVPGRIIGRKSVKVFSFKMCLIEEHETWCKVRKYDHYKKCYIWVLVNKAER